MIKLNRILLTFILIIIGFSLVCWSYQIFQILRQSNELLDLVKNNELKIEIIHTNKQIEKLTYKLPILEEIR